MELVLDQNMWFHLEQTMFPSESLSVNQTNWTDMKLKVLAVPNQGKNINDCTVSPHTFVSGWRLFQVVDQNPRNKQDVGLISWQK